MNKIIWTIDIKFTVLCHNFLEKFHSKVNLLIVEFSKIIIDGYSLSHEWRDLAPEYPRYSEACREAIIKMMVRYADYTGIPIIIVFDGSGKNLSKSKVFNSSMVEVVFSGGGKTADEIIERMVYKTGGSSKILVVTDDHTERETVNAIGCQNMSCKQFIDDVNSALNQINQKLKQLNIKEKAMFNRYRNL